MDEYPENYVDWKKTNTYFIISFIYHFLKDKIIEIENSWVVARGHG